MDIKFLKYFLKVAELQSVSKAAECFNISQPAMSKAISQLEWEANTPLFDRIGRRLVLNEHGKLMQKSVMNSVKELDDGFNKVKSLAKSPMGIVRIAGFSANNIIAASMSAFSSMYSQVNFIVRTNNNNFPQYDLSDFDLVFFADHMHLKDIESTPLLTEKFVAIMHKDHPLANRAEIDLMELKDDRFVFYEQAIMGVHDYTYSLCLDAGFTPRVAYETDNNLIKPQLVACGAAVSLVPELSISEHKRFYPTMAFIPLRTPKYSRTVFIGWKKDNYLTDVARSFKDFAVKYYSDLVKSKEIFNL